MHSTTILPERGAALAELDQLHDQWKRGLLSEDEYRAAFTLIDLAHYHTWHCENGDGRIATLKIAGRMVCSDCAVMMTGAKHG